MATDENKGASSSIEFRRFDIVSDASDHHYCKNNQSKKDRDSFTNVKVHKDIMREWNILESHLPDSIYVRVFETRIDLIQAVIIGASGTPYHDGLFFFDICLPPDYPNSPPQVMYHAHGFRLNPNLYATGFVCLSLINTWNGAKREKWMHNKSTVLQLLVSLQGLVLNDKPYFNEPGSGVPDKRTPEVLRKSIDYNENAFLLSCKTMLCKMRNPPKHFESLVTGHFQRRAKHILASIEAYKRDLCLVGDYKEDGPSLSIPYLVSAKFKTDINNIYRDLKVAFEKIEKSAQIAGNSERANNVSQSNVAATQSVAKIAYGLQKPKAVASQSNVAAIQSVAKIASAIPKPKAAAKKQKGSKRKGVWKKFTSVLASIFKI